MSEEEWVRGTIECLKANRSETQDLPPGTRVKLIDENRPGVVSEWRFKASLYDGMVTVVFDDSPDEFYAYEPSRLECLDITQPETKGVPGVEGKGDLSGKPHMAYLDPHLEYEMGMGMRYGATKHGWNNHRKLTDQSAQHIMDSLKRHLNAYLRGEQIDPESGVHHLACLMNNANFIYRLDRLYGYDTVLRNVFGETK